VSRALSHEAVATVADDPAAARYEARADDLDRARRGVTRFQGPWGLVGKGLDEPPCQTGQRHRQSAPSCGGEAVARPRSSTLPAVSVATSHQRGIVNDTGITAPRFSLKHRPADVAAPQRFGGRSLTLVLGLLAAVPVIVSVVRALAAAWTPVFDDAIVATNAFDVLTGHSPLVGIYSDASVTSIGVVHDPGPLLLWLLALPAHFLGAWALVVIVGVVNVASVVGVVVLARRRGGQTFMFVTAVALIVMTGSLPAENWHEPLNSSSALLPFMLLLFLAWSVGCDEIGLLPLTVLVASFVMQTHFSLVIVSVGILIVAFGGLALSQRRVKATPTAESSRRWIVSSLIVLLICWLAPLIDQVVHRPGNFVRILQTATAHQRTVGIGPGWHATVRALGIWPWWLRSSQNSGLRFYDVIFTPGLLATASTVILIVALAYVAVLGWRRARRDVMVAALMGLVIAAAVAMSVASTPARLSLAVEKAVRWTLPAGMFVWLVLAWSLWTLLPSPRLLTKDRWRQTVARCSPQGLLALGLVMTAAAAALVSLAQKPDSLVWTYRPARTLVTRLVAHLPRRRTVLVDGVSHSGDLTAFAFQTALIYDLRRRGYQVVVPPEQARTPGLALVDKLGSYYALAPHQPHVHLLVEDSDVPSTGGPILARVSLSAAPRSVEPRTPIQRRAIVVSAVPVSNGQ
jgi:hypothetical protein